jgi:hypothetical protein
MARVYMDEDFPGPATRRLRELGHDVLTAREAGNADRQMPDHEVLRFAQSENRAVLTLNRRDFIRLHNSGAVHSGIIACTDDRNFTALAIRVHDALCANEPLAGKLIRIIRPSHTC